MTHDGQADLEIVELQLFDTPAPPAARRCSECGGPITEGRVSARKVCGARCAGERNRRRAREHHQRQRDEGITVTELCEMCDRPTYVHTHRRRNGRPENAALAELVVCTRCQAKPEYTFVRRAALYHGASVEQCRRMLTNDVCEGCHEPFTRSANRQRNAEVDHDHVRCHHDTKYGCARCIRGMLCHRCNTMLGAVADSTDVLRSLVEYLERWGAKIQSDDTRGTTTPTPGARVVVG